MARRDEPPADTGSLANPSTNLKGPQKKGGPLCGRRKKKHAAKHTKEGCEGASTARNTSFR